MENLCDVEAEETKVAKADDEFYEETQKEEEADSNIISVQYPSLNDKKAEETD